MTARWAETGGGRSLLFRKAGFARARDGLETGREEVSMGKSENLLIGLLLGAAVGAAVAYIFGPSRRLQPSTPTTSRAGTGLWRRGKRPKCSVRRSLKRNWQRRSGAILRDGPDDSRQQGRMMQRTTAVPALQALLSRLSVFLLNSDRWCRNGCCVGRAGCG